MQLCPWHVVASHFNMVTTFCRNSETELDCTARWFLYYTWLQHNMLSFALHPFDCTTSSTFYFAAWHFITYTPSENMNHMFRASKCTIPYLAWCNSFKKHQVFGKVPYSPWVSFQASQKYQNGIASLKTLHFFLYSGSTISSGGRSTHSAPSQSGVWQAKQIRETKSLNRLSQTD